MTAISMATAVSEMEARFRDVWSPRLCQYPNQKFAIPTDPSIVWARWNCIHATGSQSSLSTVTGKRRWIRTGNIIVQVFTPLNSSELSAYDAAEIVVGGYEGKTTPSGAWFRNVRIQEVNRGVNGSLATDVNLWSQKNVVADFLYEQIH
jgi:hypothetical protein